MKPTIEKGRRIATAYAVGCYLIGVATCLYAVGFVGNVVVPHTIDRRVTGFGWTPSDWLSHLINAGLVALFAVQHSGMARTPFKRWSARWVPASVERSTYVLASSIALALLMVLWQPVPMVLWTIGPPGSWLLSSLALVGLTLIAVASVQIDFAELFGLRQAMSADSPSVPFQEPGLYRFVRHPLMLGLLLALWAAPSMTVGRLFFNSTITAYILVAIRWEEGELLERFGEPYADYRRRVPALIPWLGRGGVEKVVR